MVVLLFAVQACLWAHAAAMVEWAAAQGNQVADLSAGATQPGIDKAQEVLAAIANGVVVDPVVQSRLLGDGRVDLRISGDVESLLPWIRLSVSAERVGVIQRFRPDR